MVDDKRDVAPKAPKKVPKAPKKAPKKVRKTTAKKTTALPDVSAAPEGSAAIETPMSELEEMYDMASAVHLDLILDVAGVTYQLLWRAADFHILFVRPTFDVLTPPRVYAAEPLASGEGMEHVYPIMDFGFMLSTSRGEEMYLPGMSMSKMHNTIEKMVVLLIDKLKEQSGTGEIDPSTEIQIAFDGFILAKRKAFESIINLPYNVVVTNFDPGAWGERYLEMVKQMADQYGYPTETPRPEAYRQAHHDAKRPSRS